MAPRLDQYDLKNVIADNKWVGLIRLAQGYQFQYVIANLALGIASLARTATSFLLRFFVDDYLSAGDRRFDILLIALGFVLLAAAQGGFTFISGKLAAETSEGVTRRLRNYLFDHIQRLSFAYHNRTDTGELIQRVTSDVDAIRRFFADQAIGLGRIFFMFTVNFVAIMTINVKLALISVVVVPFIVLVSRFFFKKVSAMYQLYQEQEAVVSTTLQENLTGVRVVKAFA
ncbi:MAG: ABC transporter transmembrane domain-containing protein, partial [Anaerolineaceae bacterium]